MVSSLLQGQKFLHSTLSTCTKTAPDVELQLDLVAQQERSELLTQVRGAIVAKHIGVPKRRRVVVGQD